MEFSPNWLSVSLVIGAIVTVVIAWRAWRLPVFPGRLHFIAVECAILWWTICVAIEHGMQLPGQAEFFAELAQLGIVAAPSCWCLFIWNYLYGRRLPSPAICDVIVGLMSVGIWLLALTNDAHHLIYTDIIMVKPPPHALFQYAHGTVYFAYHMILTLGAVAAYCSIIYSIINADKVYRRHYIWLAIGMSLPWIFNNAYVLNAFYFIPFDPTPFTFVVTNAIFYWLIRSRQLFDLLPIAHGLLLDMIPDPILVVDGAGRVVECNNAARRLVQGMPLVGMPISEVAEFGENFATLLKNGHQPGQEVVVGSPPKYFDIGQVPLTFAAREIGRLVMLRDISHRKLAEQQVQAAMVALEAQLQQNLLLQEKLREEAIRDPLTGLHNRRFLGEVVPVLFAEADRAKQPLALVMIDIDHFKKLNDNHGHAAGDAVLQALGAFLRQNSRQADVVFRLGGEEFLILLPRTEEAQALIRVESWRIDFAARPIAHDGHDLSVTYSAGLAMFPEDAKSLVDLLHFADVALYQAKSDGRNRTCRWRPDMAGVARKFNG